MKRFTALTCLSMVAAGCGGSSSSDPIEPISTMVEAPPVSSNIVSMVANYECNPLSKVGLTPEMQAAITLAQTQYLKVITSATNNDRAYLSYTDTNGMWEAQNATIWTSGFLPGIYWYLYGLTSVESWRNAAEASSAGLRTLATGTDNDTGFQIYTSYGTGRQILGGMWNEADVALNEAANTLITERYNPTIGAFRSWPQNKDDPFDINSAQDFEVNVDMLMNMEAVLSAAQTSDNQVLRNAAISHADIAWQSLFRNDASSHHVGAFEADGTLSYTRTHQGWNDQSTWSRGQSWAVYSHAMLYRYTQLPRMLERSELAYDYFKQAAHIQNTNWIPYADFDAPIDIRNPLDTSAAAIVASAAIELYGITNNTLYLDDANDILNQLLENYAPVENGFESILIAGSEQYVTSDDDRTANSEGYEVGTIFGDFYFLEALYRLKNATSPVCN